MALYVSVSAAAVASAGAGAFGATDAQGAAAPLELVARGFAWPQVSVIVSAGAITAMMGVLLNLILGLSRVMMAMGRDGELPRWLGHVSADSGSPQRAVLVMGCIVAALVCVGDVGLTWRFSALTVLLYYGLTNLTALRMPPEQRRYPRAVAWLGLFACVGLAAFVPGPIWLAGAALMDAGFGARAWLSSRP